MSARRLNSMSVAWRRRGGRLRGFVLLEVGFALLVVVLGAGLVLTLAGRFQQRRNCDHYIQDLRIFSTAFEDHFQQRKTWPPASNAETALPPDIAEALKDTNWLKGSPFGGSYGWVAPEPAGGGGPGREWRGRGAVTLTAFSPSFPLSLHQADLLYIDGQIDDGNLATGRFRTGFNGWPVFLVEAAKR